MQNKWNHFLIASKSLLTNMKRNTFFTILFLAMLGSSTFLKAQDITSKNGYTLIFESNFSALDPKLKKRLIETFFIVYPKLAKEYNPNTAKQVTFFVDTAYKGVAATANDRVVFSSMWMVKHPEDIDVVTHEVMHIVQNYGESVGPSWLTEGIADFARSKFGIDNAGARWTLPEPKPEHSYKNSYRITARFFTWMEAKVKSGVIKVVDASLRDHTYINDIWKKQTGKTLDELWAEYVKNPALT
jgi:hypothetical protein